MSPSSSHLEGTNTETDMMKAFDDFFFEWSYVLVTTTYTQEGEVQEKGKEDDYHGNKTNSLLRRCNRALFHAEFPFPETEP